MWTGAGIFCEADVLSMKFYSSGQNCNKVLDVRKKALSPSEALNSAIAKASKGSTLLKPFCMYQVLAKMSIFCN